MTEYLTPDDLAQIGSQLEDEGYDIDVDKTPTGAISAVYAKIEGKPWVKVAQLDDLTLDLIADLAFGRDEAEAQAEDFWRE